ncbi:MAG: hypothetical protein ACOCU1_03245 [Bacillota bacterium]
MVLAFYIIQFVYALFTGYVTGQELEREAEIVGGLFLGATAVCVVMAIIGLPVLHIILVFVLWMAVSLLTSEIVRAYFKD